MNDSDLENGLHDQFKRGSVLRDERLKQLLDSCQQEVLRQIIGPFGLTPAMFADKDGGNWHSPKSVDK